MQGWRQRCLSGSTQALPVLRWVASLGAAGCWADIRAGAQGLLGLRAILPDLWLSG